ncbi:hypothetical protein [Telluribacter sp.]|uniref:hypothetical protein n=1 Tax=Telluribacter sp. TaxID=1978767 RepID=UPI002E0E1FAF|nr:hypothetical protein [Telluribacter sp.]
MKTPTTANCSLLLTEIALSDEKVFTYFLPLNLNTMKLYLFIRFLIVLKLFLFISYISKAQFAKEAYDFKEVGEKGLTEIQFVGTGDLQVSVNEKKDLPASTGLGAIFWRIWPNNQFDDDIDDKIWNKNPEWKSGSKKMLMSGMELQLEVKINVASTTDTISAKFRNNSINSIINSRAFGSYTLAPVSSGPSTTVNSIFYFKPKYYNDFTGVTYRGIPGKSILVNNIIFKYIDGIELGFTAANQVWSINSDTLTKDVSIYSWRAGIFHEFLPDLVRRTKGYSVRLGLNYTGRSIKGDAGMKTEDASSFRRMLLQHDKISFHGAEIVLSLRLRNIRAEASVPMLNMRSKSQIPGLTGSQFLTSISFVGGFPLSIN